MKVLAKYLHRKEEGSGIYKTHHIGNKPSIRARLSRGNPLRASQRIPKKIVHLALLLREHTSVQDLDMAEPSDVEFDKYVLEFGGGTTLLGRASTTYDIPSSEMYEGGRRTSVGGVRASGATDSLRCQNRRFGSALCNIPLTR